MGVRNVTVFGDAGPAAALPDGGAVSATGWRGELIDAGLVAADPHLDELDPADDPTGWGIRPAPVVAECVVHRRSETDSTCGMTRGTGLHAEMARSFPVVLGSYCLEGGGLDAPTPLWFIT